jgi:hypothetical protein
MSRYTLVSHWPSRPRENRGGNSRGIRASRTNGGNPDVLVKPQVYGKVVVIGGHNIKSTKAINPAELVERSGGMDELLSMEDYITNGCKAVHDFKGFIRY